MSKSVDPEPKAPCTTCGGFGFVRKGSGFGELTYPRCTTCNGEGLVAVPQQPALWGDDDNYAWGYLA